MTPLLLVGGGGHCRACIDVIESQGEFLITGIVQSSSDLRDAVLGYSVLGADKDLPSLLDKTPSVLITVGQIKSPDTRMRLFKLLKSLNAHLPIIKSPTAYCSAHANLGEGTILMHSSTVNAQANIGANCIINSQALIEHDVEVEDHCHIATGARVNGGVRIREGAFIGSGAIIREGIEIGSAAVVGAGQVVLDDVPGRSTVRTKRD